CILTVTPSFLRGGFGYGLIEHVVTSKEFRRQGFARAILEYVIREAWETGCTEILLLTGSHNRIAQKMYESLGFDGQRKVGFILYKEAG
ncbi:MAG: GNAT family N-acetyltransferase, partial [Candidatus Ozemobacteraceae bacterium]